MPKKVLIGVPTYSGQLNIELVKSLDNIKLPEGWGVAKAYAVRTPIHMSRNILMQKAVEGNYDYLIMIDDDEYPMSEDVFYRLVSAGKDMVSGVVRLRVRQENLNILHAEDYTEGDMAGMKKYVCYQDIPQRGLFKIDNAGSGLICLSLKVCKEMLEVYGNEPFESKQTTYVKLDDGTFIEFGYSPKNVFLNDGKPVLCRRVLSEDYLFFERAISLGYELRCEPQAKAVHLGEPIKIYP